SIDLGMEGEEGAPAAAAVEEGESAEAETTVPVAAGMNRFIWDMREESATKVEGDKSMPMFLVGPMVLEGTYEVRLTLGDRSLTQSLEIVPDPRGVQSLEDRRVQYDLLVK